MFEDGNWKEPVVGSKRFPGKKVVEH